MTVSILNEVLLLKDQHLFEIEKYLHSVGVHIFDYIINHMSADEAAGNLEKQEAKQTILYILCAYSEDSPLIILRQDDKTEKDAICTYLHIPELYRPALLNLTAADVRTAVTTYVSQFAGPLFRNLCFLKIQLADYQLNITNRNYGAYEKLDDEGKPINWLYDNKEHAKSVTETIRLSKEIDKLEKEIRGQVKRFEGIETLKEWKSKSQKKQGGARSGNVENSQFIK